MLTTDEALAARKRLAALLRRHPTWTIPQYAQALGVSRAWIKKWKPRLSDLPYDSPEELIQNRSCAPKHRPPRLAHVVVERILQLRDVLPARLHRIPGPKTIFYYLHHERDLAPDQPLFPADVRLPRSPTTIWRVLRQYQRILARPTRRHEPLEVPAPMEEWEIDYTDVTSVAPDPAGKQQHTAEVLNVIDRSTSTWLGSRVRGDFTQRTTIEELLVLFREHGLPTRLRCDRDPRLVGNAGNRDFPSALLQLLLNLGIEPIVCPPYRADLKPFVERLHRTPKAECLQVARPSSIPEAQRVSETFRHFYNAERPHQGRRCANRPPQVAFPTLPRLRELPETIDPDGWLRAIDGQAFVRRVDAAGTIKVNAVRYDITTALAGQQVQVEVVAATREFRIMRGLAEVKRLPIKGLVGTVVPLADYVELLLAQARREQWR